MDTNALKKFAQAARNLLIDQVTARLDMVLSDGAAARRETPKAVARLEAAVATSRQQVIDQAAYTWFNRFTALRFMDATGLTNPRVVSPADGATRPEILAEALAGNLPDAARPEIAEYLNGTRPAHDGQAEAYRLLVIHACNDWHGPMPFMFEQAEDYTELLMPDDLLSPTSILARLREVMTEEACKDVEIIGWLYQFYISEKKDQVFAGLKKNVKITAENIPAATQLFTPHWIVRYLVENSLGRLWLLNRPESKLPERMDYYIAPEEPETDFLEVGKPEEIKICDPACGSGHMLTYAFDLLYAIYEEEGYEADRIPALILANNLTGVEIDDRAGALAAFALAMKAAAKLGRRRFLRMEVKPDICVLQDVSFTPAEMQDVAAVVGKDLFTDELRETLGQFGQAKNFGSLIVPKLRDPAETLRVVEARDFGSDLLLKEVQERVIAVLRMAEALSPKYHVVVANPPYMGSGGMNDRLNAFGREQFCDSRSDLFAMFMERSLMLGRASGIIAMINMQSWMFLSSFEKLRTKLLSKCSILNMAHLGERGFDSIGGAVVSTTAFSILNSRKHQHVGEYLRLVDGQSETEKARLFFEAKAGEIAENLFRVQDELFKLVPGQAIAYWLSPEILKLFNNEKLGEKFDAKEGVGTRNDEVFMRLQWEVSRSNVGRHARWIQSDKAGDARRWYMGFNFLMDWEDDGFRIKNYRNEDGSLRSRPQNTQFLFQSGVTWAKVSAGAHAFRWRPEGYGFNDAAPTLFGEEAFHVLGQLNSVVMKPLLAATGNTINISTGTLGSLPILDQSFLDEPLQRNSKNLVNCAKSDWDAYETSWDFTTLPLLSLDHRGATLEDSYATLRAHWQSMTDEMQRLEVSGRWKPRSA